ncbi:DUF1684 domain-containing protein [Pseudarthrobacter sp. J1738]|uniref:DUF1684 domain-containing protein n=1 Tax=unclassified Pseudarthrobacter TaxID=2647000 RepID=UPI003D2D6211
MNNAAPAKTDPQVARWERFRHSRNTALATEFGWLTLTSFQWLPPQPGTLEMVPGLWSTDGTAATLTASAADGLRFVDTGEAVDGTYTQELQDEESLNWVQYGGTDGSQVQVELAVRGGKFAIRTRDSSSPVFTDFNTVPTYAFDPTWAITARWEPYPEPREIPIGTANPLVGGVHRSVGEVVFELPGTDGKPQEYRLQAEEEKLGALTITFHDATNGDTTDDWRKVSTAKPRPNGTVVVDFNRAINYPSAFTPYGTCPMPVKNNSLDVRVEAGEKDPTKG